jgi:hypothetical protein
MQLLLMIVLAFDLNSVKLEPNLERRSELAMDNANAALDSAREAFNMADAAKMEGSLREVSDSVELAYQSLSETGKDARRSPKFFKRAELRTRELLRRLDGLYQAVDVESRTAVEKVRDQVAQVHDDLLKGIMSKKK